MLKSESNIYEIAIDKKNMRISITKNSISISSAPIHTNHFRFRIWSIDNYIKINNGKKLYIKVNVDETFPLRDINVKTSVNTNCEIEFDPVNNKGFYFMDKGNAPGWSEFYSYYSAPNFDKDTIIKCDDDIVYIDLNRLPDFISYINNSNNRMVFANIINNGISAYYQQLNRLIPEQIGNFEYPALGLCGTLWGSAEKATALHKFFIRNIDNFINSISTTKTVEIEHRFSINFFAMKGENWHLIKNIGGDDDEAIIANLKNKVLYEEFFVSHLSFIRQVEEGLDLPMLRELYSDLATKNGL